MKLDELSNQNSAKQNLIMQRGDVLNQQNTILGKLRSDNKNLNDQLNEIENSIQDNKNTSENLDKIIEKIEDDFQRLTANSIKSDNDLVSAKNNLDKEKINNAEEESNIQNLKVMLEQKKEGVKNLEQTKEQLKKDIEATGFRKLKLKEDIERYKSYMLLLSELTLKLSEELERIAEEDEQMNTEINMDDKMLSIARENQIILKNIAQSYGL